MPVTTDGIGNKVIPVLTNHNIHVDESLVNPSTPWAFHTEFEFIHNLQPDSIFLSYRKHLAAGAAAH